MTTTDRSQRGFTLVEILTVITIMAAMASMVRLAAADQSAQRVELAVFQVCDALRRAQALAESTREPHGVVFDVDDDRLIVVDEDGDPAIDPLTHLDYFVDFVRPNQPGNVEIQYADFGTAGTSALFDAQGVPLTGGTVALVCRHQGRIVTLDPATGEATHN